MPIRGDGFVRTIALIEVELSTLIEAPRTTLLIILVWKFVRLPQNMDELLTGRLDLQVELSMQIRICLDHDATVEAISEWVELPAAIFLLDIVELVMVDDPGLVIPRASGLRACYVLVIIIGQAVAASWKTLHAVFVELVAAPAGPEVLGDATHQAWLVPAILLAVGVR